MTAVLAALVTSAVLVGVVTAVLPRLGVMDVPNHRSSHSRPVPRGGGLALAPAVAVGLSATSAWSPATVLLLLGAVVLGAVGMVDDVRDVGAAVRLALQVGVSLVVALGLVLASPATSTATAALVVVVAVPWLTGYVNVYNFMDGANGVAGWHAVVAGAWFALVGAQHDATAVEALGAALLGASLGFLPWNFPRARVFLGDVGSYSVGLLLGALAVATFLATHSPVLALAPLVVFLVDTGLTLVRRAHAGAPVMTAHREHVYQRITLVPGSPWPAVTTTVTSCLCVAAAAALGTVACLVCWVVVLALYVALPSLVASRAATG